MIRKLIIALGATAVGAAAALSPTTASASGWHGHHGHHGWHRGFGFGFYAPTYVGGPDCYVVRRLIDAPYGKRWRRVTVCD